MSAPITVKRSTAHGNGYPTSDGRPMAETDLHRDLMLDLIETLKEQFAADPQTYVSGNILLFYEEGNKRKHVSPDVLVVRGVPKHRRDNYLIWEEGKGPDLVIELTSATTRMEDQKKKSDLYRKVLRVPEYFMFDPRSEYLNPPFQGYRLNRGRFVAIRPIDGRLPSEVIGLHLERLGQELRVWDPVTGNRVPTPHESKVLAEAERNEAQAERNEAQAERNEAQAERNEADAARKAAEDENDRLRREIEELKRKQ